MATHSSVLAWRIPGTGEPGGPPFMGSHRVGHDWSDLAAAAEFLPWQTSKGQRFRLFQFVNPRPWGWGERQWLWLRKGAQNIAFLWIALWCVDLQKGLDPLKIMVWHAWGRTESSWEVNGLRAWGHMLVLRFISWTCIRAPHLWAWILTYTMGAT